MHSRLADVLASWGRNPFLYETGLSLNAWKQRCLNTPPIQGIIQNLVRLQNEVHDHPAGVLALMTRNPQEVLRSISMLYDFASNAAAVSPSPMPQPVATNILAARHPYLQPLITLIADRRRVVVLRRPPLGQVARPTSASPTPPAVSSTELPVDVDLIFLPPSTQPAEAQLEETHSQAGTPTGERRPSRNYHPRQIRIPLSAWVQILLRLNDPHRNSMAAAGSLIRHRWTPEMTRYMARSEITPEIIRLFLRNMEFIVGLNPGPIPGPFGRGISRELAHTLYRIALRRDLNGGRVSWNWAGTCPSVSQINRACFNSPTENNAFLQELNRRFGPPNIPPH